MKIVPDGGFSVSNGTEVGISIVQAPGWRKVVVVEQLDYENRKGVMWCDVVWCVCVCMRGCW